MFFDNYSNRIERQELSEAQKRHYLQEIRFDIEYFSRFYRKADYRVYVGAASVDDVVTKIRGMLRVEVGKQER